MHVCVPCSEHNLPNDDPNNMHARRTPTAEQAAERLGVSMRTVRELLRTNVLAGTQVVKFAPWQIPVDALNSAAVVERVQRIRTGNHSRVPPIPHDDILRLPGM
jgi:excisionase family DNA binding protein